ncbi:aldose epimerase family protein [Nocardioides dilutus]
MQTFTIGSSDLQAAVLTQGATLHRLRVCINGRSSREVVLSLRTPELRHESRDYIGVSVGRYANRIARGSFRLGDVEYQLPVNDRGNTLHGGPAGFDRQLWDVLEVGSDHVELGLTSPDGDQGFPGTLVVRARFEVSAGVLRTTYRATTDAPTPVNLTNHAYYNLDDLKYAGSMHGQHLRLPADAYLPVDATGLPTGEVVDVTGTPYDARSPRRLGDLPPLDHTFVVAGQGMREMATLESTSGDLRMVLASNQPGLQVYTGTGMGAGGSPHPREGSGVALEPQHFPDSVNHPEWPSTILLPGEEYLWESEARFTVLDAP